MFSVLGKNGFRFYRFMDRDDRFMHVIHKQFQTNINTQKNTEYVENTVYCTKQGYTCQMREDSVSG